MLKCSCRVITRLLLSKIFTVQICIITILIRETKLLKHRYGLIHSVYYIIYIIQCILYSVHYTTPTISTPHRTYLVIRHRGARLIKVVLVGSGEGGSLYERIGACVGVTLQGRILLSTAMSLPSMSLPRRRRATILGGHDVLGEMLRLLRGG